MRSRMDQAGSLSLFLTREVSTSHIIVIQERPPIAAQGLRLQFAEFGQQLSELLW